MAGAINSTCCSYDKTMKLCCYLTIMQIKKQHGIISRTPIIRPGGVREALAINVVDAAAAVVLR